MADEIINKLGFDVQDALSALARLDSALATSGTSLTNHAQSLNTWNTAAQAALVSMREMATLASKIGVKPVSVGGSAAQASSASAETLTKFNEALAQTTNTGARVNLIGDQIRIMGARSKEALDEATNSAKSFMISVQMLSRIVITQMLVRALSAVRNGLEDATTDAIELQTHVAEIFVIAPKTDTFKSLTNEILSMSDAFNVPALQVAEGLYQTISDQFVSAGDRANIMTAALQLSRTGVVDLGSAVTLLTSTLNAYGMESSRAGLLAGQFMKVIELGHVRGKELADTMGQILPVAQQLGVSIQEVGAAYVSMTIGGLDAHKASTGLRQAMVAFIKPSEDMKKSMRDMGFSTPEQLFAAKGLIGAMESISKAHNGMSAGISESMRNIRAFTAEMSLTRKGSQKYTEALKQIGEVTAKTMSELSDKFRKSMPAEEFTTNINKLKNALTRDLGTAITEVLGKLTSWVGINNISASIQALIPVLGLFGTALLALAAKAAIAYVALGPVGWIIAGIGVAITSAVAISSFQTAKYLSNMRDMADATKAANQKITQDLVARNQEELRIMEDGRKKKVKEFEEMAAGVRKANFAIVDSTQAAIHRQIEDTRVLTGAILQSQERVVSAVRNAATAAANAVTQSVTRRKAAEADYADYVFKLSLKGQSSPSQAEAQMRRSRQLQAEAQRLAASAKTPEDIEAVQATQQRAESAAQEAVSMAQSAKSSSLQEDAERNLLYLKKSKIETERTVQSVMLQQTKTLSQAGAIEQQRLNTMKEAQKQILESLKTFDKGEQRTPQQLAAQRATLQTSLKTFLDAYMQGRPAGIAELLEVDKLQQRIKIAMEGGISKQEISTLTALPGTIKQLHDQIETGLGAIHATVVMTNTQLPTEMQKQLKGMTPAETFDYYSQQYALAQGELQKTEALKRAIDEKTLAATQTRKTLAETMAEWVKQAQVTSLGPQRASRAKTFEPTAWKQLRDLTVEELPEKMAATPKFMYEQLKRMMETPVEKLDTKAFEKLATAKAEYVKRFNPSQEEIGVLDKVLELAAKVQSSAIEAGGKMKELDTRKAITENAQKASEALPKAMQELKKITDKAKTDAESAKVSAISAQEAGTALSAMTLSSLVTDSSTIANNMWDAALAASTISNQKTPMTATRGGPVGYFANGGPVGKDTIPAWLTSGEYVMNAEATRKFSSQLIAMNAGVRPAYRSDGGSVTNIGDINVTVSGGSNGRQTARTIAAEIRRELRRGTATL